MALRIPSVLLNQIKSFVLRNKNIIYYRPWLALCLLVCIVRYFPKLYMWLYRNPLRHGVIESDPAFNNSHLYRGSQGLKHSSQTVGRKNSLLIEGNQAQGGGVICYPPVGSEWKKRHAVLPTEILCIKILNNILFFFFFKNTVGCQMFMNGLTKEALHFLLPTAKISLSHLLSNQFPLSSITHSLPDIIFSRCQCCSIFYFAIFLL